MEVVFGVKILLWLKRIFSNKYVLIGIGVVALLGGGYLFYKHQVNTQVATKVEQHDDKATIQTYKTKDTATTEGRKIDNKYDVMAAKTAKDYDHVRNTTTTPTDLAGANAPLDPLLLDTFNQLARLHTSGSADGVSNSSN